MRVVVTLLIWAVCGSLAVGNVVVLHASSGTTTTTGPFIAKQLLRYVYLTTGILPSIHDANHQGPIPQQYDVTVVIVDKHNINTNHTILVALPASMTVAIRRDLESAAPYTIRGVQAEGGAVVVCASGTSEGLLWCGYRLAEHFGMAFHLDGEVPPDPDTRREVAEVVRHLTTLVEVAPEPTFNVRGLQPFHDFMQGPDWWSADQYQSVISQISKLRMNFIGLHTYPVSPKLSTGTNEPTVWVGLKDQVNADGTVKSSYPTSYANSLRGQWGNEPLATGNYTFGASQLFPEDCYGSDVQVGNCPFPTTPEGNNQVFDATGRLLSDAFHFAQKVAVKTCVGTETPLSTPQPSLIPLQLWYSQERKDHFLTTTDCEECPPKVYTKLGVEGYVYSQAGPNRVPLYTLFNSKTHDNLLSVNKTGPAGYAMVRVEGYASTQKNDEATVPLQVWRKVADDDTWDLASQASRTAAQAAGYSQVSSLPAFVAPTAPTPPTTQEYYEGMFTRIQRTYPIDYYWIWTPERWEWSKVTKDNPDFKKAVADLDAAVVARDAVNATWEMATCGWVLGPLPNRTIFDQVLSTRYAAITSIDMNVGNTPVDPAYAKVTRHHKWAIPWMEDDPGLTAPELWVNRTLAHMRDAHKYGCQGLLGIHWRTRQVSPQISAMAQASWDPALTAADFWDTWATGLFGAAVGHDVASVFASIDSFNTPRPVGWIGGPGGFSANAKQCDPKPYAFVDTLTTIRGKVVGAMNLWRFDYWLRTFQYMRAIARVECAWDGYNKAMAIVEKEPDLKKRAQLARALALPIRIQMVKNSTEMMDYLLSTMSTPGGLGTIHNVLSHSLTHALTALAPALSRALQAPLPSAALPPHTYGGPPMIIVPVVRNELTKGQSFNLKVLLLVNDPSTTIPSVLVFIRPMGGGATKSVAMKCQGRHVYQVSVADATTQEDFEYYVETKVNDQELYYPPQGIWVAVSVLQ